MKKRQSLVLESGFVETIIKELKQPQQQMEARIGTDTGTHSLRAWLAKNTEHNTVR